MYVAIFVIFTVLAIGFYILGYVFGRRHYTSQSIGQLRVDRSDEDGPYLWLELEKPLNSFIHDTYVIMKVNTESYISQSQE